MCCCVVIFRFVVYLVWYVVAFSFCSVALLSLSVFWCYCLVVL